MRRPIVVAFDVSNDLKRDLVRGVLRRAGWAYQRSVWSIVPKSAGVDVRFLASGLSTFMAANDRLLVVEPCVDCHREALWLPAGYSPWPSGPSVI